MKTHTGTVNQYNAIIKKFGPKFMHIQTTPNILSEREGGEKETERKHEGAKESGSR